MSEKVDFVPIITAQWKTDAGMIAFELDAWRDPGNKTAPLSKMTSAQIHGIVESLLKKYTSKPDLMAALDAAGHRANVNIVCNDRRRDARGEVFEVDLLPGTAPDPSALDRLLALLKL
jgi:hypothetical protein